MLGKRATSIRIKGKPLGQVAPKVMIFSRLTAKHQASERQLVRRRNKAVQCYRMIKTRSGDDGGVKIRRVKRLN
jgi:hypothetical protein